MGRFTDWVNGLTAKTSTIDGTESVPIVNSGGTTQKATLANLVRYGGGSPRNTTVGNATVTQTTDGALYLEVAGQTAGNARGAGAFDWQAVRNAAAKVASGANAIAIGVNCTSSNDQSVAVGNACTASGQYSLAVGSGCQATQQATVAMGFNCIASGVRSAVLGGWQNSAIAEQSVALTGRYAYATNTAQIAFGYAPSAGQAQGNLQTCYTATTDATSTPLNISGAATDRMVIPATRACAFTGIVLAMCNVSSSSNFVRAWKIEGIITRDGNNTTRLVGTPLITDIGGSGNGKDADGTPTPSTWAIASITADDTNESLAINVTGQAATTIRWQATLLYSQVGF